MSWCRLLPKTYGNDSGRIEYGDSSRFAGAIAGSTSLGDCFGLPQLHNSETLLSSFDELNADLMCHIEGIRDFLLTRGRVTASFTGSDTGFEKTRTKLGEWLSTMRDEPILRNQLRFNRLRHRREKDWPVLFNCILRACDAGTTLFTP